MTSIDTAAPTRETDDCNHEEQKELIAKNPDLYKLIKFAMQETIDASIAPRLTAVENDLKSVSSKVDVVEKDLTECCNKLDKVSESLALRLVDNELHARKWHIIITNLPGPVNEKPLDTTKNVLDFGVAVYGNVRPPLTACHRLKTSANSKIIVSFMNLLDRDFWLQNAKQIKAYNISNNLRISIQPDLPPPLRPLQSDLLKERANLDQNLRRQSYVKYWPHWPYVELITMNNGQKKVTKHAFSKEDLLVNIFKT